MNKCEYINKNEIVNEWMYMNIKWIRKEKEKGNIGVNEEWEKKKYARIII